MRDSKSPRQDAEIDSAPDEETQGGVSGLDLNSELAREAAKLCRLRQALNMHRANCDWCERWVRDAKAYHGY